MLDYDQTDPELKAIPVVEVKTASCIQGPFGKLFDGEDPGLGGAPVITAEVAGRYMDGHPQELPFSVTLDDHSLDAGHWIDLAKRCRRIRGRAIHPCVVPSATTRFGEIISADQSKTLASAFDLENRTTTATTAQDAPALDEGSVHAPIADVGLAKLCPQGDVSHRILTRNGG